MRYASVLFLVLLVIAPSETTLTAEPVLISKPVVEDEVHQALSSFIRAFDNLDWEAFRNSFADDATVFIPRKIASRASGRAEFESVFRGVFEEIRAGRSTPPYMDIQPRDLQIQLAGDVAVATFHLDDRAGFLNRRTIVLQKFPAGWKIIHLHASEVARPKEP